jgi:prepilin-type processing-associated H-X9-DG protein
VIAIISILASLLLPSLSKAKILTNKTACKNNLKQIGSIFFMYEVDYLSFPCVDDPLMPDNYRYWTGKFLEAGFLAASKPDTYGLSSRNAGILNCPGWDNQAQDEVYKNFEYGMNPMVGDMLGVPGTYLDYRKAYYKSNQIKKASLRLLVADAWNAMIQRNVINSPYYAWFPHANQMSILYWDGHTGEIGYGMLSTDEMRILFGHQE